MMDDSSLSRNKTPTEPVLVAEDNAAIQELIYDICNRAGVSTVMASNGEEALGLMNRMKFSAYIVDLVMPVMDGKTLIPEIKAKDPGAVILVQTASSSSNTIIEVMKLGVFDYIIKPIEITLFERALLKALEYKYLRNMEERLNRSASRIFRNQLEWLQYKEHRRITKSDRTNTKSIYNLKESFARGAGAGSIVTLLELLEFSAKETGDSYSVDKETMDLIFKHGRLFGSQIRGLHSILHILEKEYELSEAKSSDIFEELSRIVSDLMSHASAKGLKIVLPDEQQNVNIEMNAEIIFPALRELIINACKYSPKDSTVALFSRIHEDYLWISVINDVVPACFIDRQYEKLILEPFYRLAPADETMYAVEEYSLGLGLTVVESVAHKHNGIFMIRTVKNLSREKKSDAVIADFLLPLAT